MRRISAIRRMYNTPAVDCRGVLLIIFKDTLQYIRHFHYICISCSIDLVTYPSFRINNFHMLTSNNTGSVLFPFNSNVRCISRSIYHWTYMKHACCFYICVLANYQKEFTMEASNLNDIPLYKLHHNNSLPSGSPQSNSLTDTRPPFAARRSSKVL